MQQGAAFSWRRTRQTHVGSRHRGAPFTGSFLSVQGGPAIPAIDQHGLELFKCIRGWPSKLLALAAGRREAVAADVLASSALPLGDLQRAAQHGQCVHSFEPTKACVWWSWPGDGSSNAISWTEPALCTAAAPPGRPGSSAARSGPEQGVTENPRPPTRRRYSPHPSSAFTLSTPVMLACRPWDTWKENKNNSLPKPTDTTVFAPLLLI